MDKQSRSRAKGENGRTKGGSKQRDPVEKMFPTSTRFSLKKLPRKSVKYGRCSLVLILARDRTPILLTKYTRVADLHAMKTEVRRLTRHVTSLLQSRVSEPVLVCPVFWSSRESLQDKVQQADAESQRLFPQGRLMMTPAKHQQLVQAATQLLQ